MQMTKNSSGITLIILVITIIILLILVGISFSLGFRNIEDTKKDLETAELYIVQQAVLQQYSKAKTLGETGKEYNGLGTQNPPTSYIGHLIKDVSELITYSNFTPLKNSNFNTYDDYYYELEEEDFRLIDVTGVTDVYIVNYSTGEVYNKTDNRYLETKLPETDLTTINTEFSDDIWN